MGRGKWRGSGRIVRVGFWRWEGRKFNWMHYGKYYRTSRKRTFCQNKCTHKSYVFDTKVIAELIQFWIVENSNAISFEMSYSIAMNALLFENLFPLYFIEENLPSWIFFSCEILLFFKAILNPATKNNSFHTLSTSEIKINQIASSHHLFTRNWTFSKVNFKSKSS